MLGYAPAGNRLCCRLGMLRAGVQFHVAPGGNDANPGTAAAPCRSLERARDALGAFKRAQALEGGAEGVIHAGTYWAPRPVTVRLQVRGLPVGSRGRWGA